jgi:hypothetical protein
MILKETFVGSTISIAIMKSGKNLGIRNDVIKSRISM